MAEHLRVTREIVEGDACIRVFAGDLDESFSAPLLDPHGARHLILDLETILHVSSFGVREWIRSLRERRASLEGLFFLQASTRVIDQFNMVVGFDCGGVLLSFFSNFLCDSCNGETLYLFDAQLDRAIFESLQVPTRQCRFCGRDARLDDDPEVLFEYVRTTAFVPPPTPVLSALKSAGASLQRIPGVRLLTRQSAVAGGTLFDFSGVIDATLPARRLVDSAIGTARLNLEHVAHFDPTGFERWRTLVGGLAEKGPCLLVKCPPVMVRRLAEDPSLLGRATVTNVVVPTRCGDCKRLVWETFEPHAVEPLLKGSTVCPVCGGQVTLAGGRPSSQDLTAVLRERPAGLPVPLPPAAEPAVSRRTTRDIEDAARAAGGQKYEELCGLGRGGMAEVHLVRQHGALGFRRLAVVKKVHNDLATDDQMMRLFLDEAKLAARIDHPNVIRVYDLGRDERSVFMVLEYVHGRSLAEIMKQLRPFKGTIPPRIAALIGADLCRGLARAHLPGSEGHTLVHRDVTPGNVLLGFDGVVKLLDFGLAGTVHRKSETGAVLGTKGWLAPEVFAGKQPTPQTDLWGVGLVLLAVITGSNPFHKPTLEESLTAVLDFELKQPWWRPARIPRRLFAIIKRALAKDPAARYPEASTMEDELRAAADRLGGEADLGKWIRALFADELELDLAFAKSSGSTNLVDALLSMTPESVRDHFAKVAALQTRLRSRE